MKFLFLLFFIFSFCFTQAQELFVFTEPASNMAAKSIGIRLNNTVMRDKTAKKNNYHLVPELMWGVSRNIMIHGEMFLSNRNAGFVSEGGSVYIKYRVLSNDGIHSHFRVAAFGRYSFNNSDIHQRAVDLNGHNSGYEGGVVFTQLKNKVALSSSVSMVHVTNNGKEKFIYGDKDRNAVNYTLSAGKLMLPKEYTGYHQTNVNLMLEILGQSNINTGNSFLDIAPSVQFIFFSQLRIDAGYRIPLVKTLSRTAAQGFIIRLEYNIFNIY